MPESKGAAAVDAWLAALDHPLKDVTASVRTALVQAEPRLGERIKWNAPSFTWEGEDKLTFNLRPKAPLLLIFHRGAKAKDVRGFSFTDETGLMDWKAPDRAVLTVASAADWDRDRDAILGLAHRWVTAA